MDNSVVTEAVLACVRFGNGPLADPRRVAALIAIRNSLATIFGTIARGIANHQKYSRWRADDANPGYLVTTFRSLELRAPWNVVGDLPEDAELEEFLGLATMVKFQSDSVICLSGSALMRSTVKAINDIDLCEYVSAADGDFTEIAAQAISIARAELICLQIGAHVADGLQPNPQLMTLRRPWSTKSIEAFLSRVAAAVTGKCDFAVKSRSESVVELTKIVLRVDARYTDTEGAWELSYPYQEIGLGAGTWVPRRLASPPAVGRYVVWLFHQIEEHAGSAPMKAAKRALSLARILNSSALANAARRLLQQDNFALKAVLKARVQFHDRLVSISDPALEPFRAQLERTVTELAQGLGITADHLSDSSAEGERPSRSAKLTDFLSKSEIDTADLEGLRAEFRRLLEPGIRMGGY